ncbi:hypothetical protein [Luteipulveratus halotolerans]|uniref:Uncharacterized protein n=1 Tax=Luteipulveratus halotolerans TaxID=1631356 RepID=A0A0L6CH52_9MICO|nr:hypothetical protein [Luteipulveratus halotolerans]KNX37136.1 hypothetical protein VV01_08240 [Luteipulveratus halotolerans]
MHTTQLDRLGYDTKAMGLVGGLDYVPDLVDTEDGLVTDFVHRSFLQLSQLDALGGVNALGGSSDRHDGIYFALEEEIDLLSAVDHFGDHAQQQRARELIAAGKVSN